MSREHARYQTVHVFDHNVGDEPQAAGVDADDGQPVGGKHACGAEHCAVAADGDGYFAFACDLMHRARLVARGVRHVTDGVFIEIRPAAGFFDDLYKFLHIAGNIAVRFCDDGNVFKALHRVFR